MADKFKILVLTTGGTIEKTYDEADGSLSNRDPITKQMIETLRLPYTEIVYEMVMAKDSLYMDDSDREIIFNTIFKNRTKYNAIVIIHGTDTMELTSKYCFEKFKAPEIPVIFTGAMKPLGFVDSDATQNVTEALMSAQLTNAGIYISFHGKIFPLPKVRKNKSAGTFESY